jgi:hypothetical protein
MMDYGGNSNPTEEAAMLSQDDEASLADLRWHWDEAYLIDCADGIWVARPLVAPGSTVSATSAYELRLAIRSDYFVRTKDRFAGC